MVAGIIFKIVLSCAPTEFQNFTNSWTVEDEAAYHATARKCEENEAAPCLGVFEKHGDNNYKWLCVQKSLFRYESQPMPEGFKN